MRKRKPSERQTGKLVFRQRIERIRLENERNGIFWSEDKKTPPVVDRKADNRPRYWESWNGTKRYMHNKFARRSMH